MYDLYDGFFGWKMINHGRKSAIADLLQRNIEDFEKLANISKFNGNVTEYTMLIAEQAFCDGFSLGVKFIAEALLAPN